MIQDIAPRVFNGQMLFDTPQPHDMVLFYKDQTTTDLHQYALVSNSSKDSLAFPRYGDFAEGLPCIFGFTIDSKRYFIVRDTKTAPLPSLPPNCSFTSLRELRFMVPRHLAFAAMTGFHLHSWYRNNIFCGHCGTRLEPSQTERALACPACKNMVYPRIAPAVIVAVTWKDRLLMTRSATGAYRYRALVAGFTEIGETAEETVAREVMEECGIRVKNVRYYKSQPWGLAGDLLLGYTCELDGDPTITLQEDELSCAEWVPRASIDEKPDNVSLTRELICAFRDQTGPFAL